MNPARNVRRLTGILFAALLLALPLCAQSDKTLPAQYAFFHSAPRPRSCRADAQPHQVPPGEECTADCRHGSCSTRGMGYGRDSLAGTLHREENVVASANATRSAGLSSLITSPIATAEATPRAGRKTPPLTKPGLTRWRALLEARRS